MFMPVKDNYTIMSQWKLKTEKVTSMINGTENCPDEQNILNICITDFTKRILN